MKGTEVTVAVRISHGDGQRPLLGHIVAEIDEGLGYYKSAERSFFDFCRGLGARGEVRKCFVQTKHGPSPRVDLKNGTVVKLAGCYPAEHLVPDGYRRMLGYCKV